VKGLRKQMGQFNSFVNAANKAMNSADALLENENTPFNAMYKQYKTLQSFWFRAMDDAAESNSKQLEELCVDLEDTVQRCEQWIKEHSPTKSKPQSTEEHVDD
jgi:hypothetical protein